MRITYTHSAALLSSLLTLASAVPTEYDHYYSPKYLTGCYLWRSAEQDDTCDLFTQRWGLDLDDLVEWNKEKHLDKDDCKLVVGDIYCVHHVPTASQLLEEMNNPTWVKARGNNNLPWPIFPATSKEVRSRCQKWHKVESCANEKKARRVQVEVAARPASQPCRNEWEGYYICDKVDWSHHPGKGGHHTGGGEGVIPGHKPPKSHHDGPKQTPTPIQAGSIDNCCAWYKVQPGDTCEMAAANSGISPNDFKNLNPYLREDCTNMLANHYACKRTC